MSIETNEELKIERNTNIDINSGLSSEQYQSRVDEGKINAESDPVTKSYQTIFRENLLTLFNLINVILAVMVILVQEYRNALFLGTIVANTAIGIFQEIRAKRVLDKLSIVTQPNVTVLRNGEQSEISIYDIVLDDIIYEEFGQQVCSDSIVVDGRVEVNESLITGESDSVIKKAGDFLYSGSFILAGSAKVQVVHVGKDNYAQRISDHAKSYKKYASQLRDSINWIIKIVGIIIIPMGIALFYNAYQTTGIFKSAVLDTTAALTGMIPEGLVLLTSVALAVSTMNLARKKVLVQEIYSIESLARVNVICLDKTGTITEGNMAVEKIITEENDLNNIIANMMNDLQDTNSTATALTNYASLETQLQSNAKLPFSSERKSSSVSYDGKGTYILGAYQFISGIQNVDSAMIDNYAQRGYRVLVVAHSEQMIENDMLPSTSKCIAYILLSDPVRKEAPKTLAYFDEQGVSVKVISGDDPRTVHSVAQKAGIKDANKFVDMSQVSDEQIPALMDRCNVFGRVSPKQKQLMIKALNDSGKVTAMMGDGVNDVMALKEANVSISVSEGSEAAKNISNLVLLDDNFASLPSVVNEGRRVINNIQRAASMFLVKTLFSIFLSIFTIVLINQYPFEPIQLTLISSLIVGIPSFFLALENNYQIVRGKFLFNVLGRAIPGAFAVVVSTLFIAFCSYVFDFTSDVNSTMSVFVTAMAYYIVLYRVSSPFSRQRLILFIASTSVFIICSLLPFTQAIFRLVSLDWFQWAILIAIMLLIPIVMNFMYVHIDNFLEKSAQKMENKER